MKKKTLLSSVIAIVLCLSLMTGASFALFTSEAKVNVAITSATVKVEATLGDEVELYSMGVQQNTAFENGGTATLTAGTLTLTNVTPGDMAITTVNVENMSNVNIQYRMTFTVTGELADYLKVSTVTGNDITDYQYAPIVKDGGWKILAANGTIEGFKLAVELPEEVGNVAQTLTGSVTFAVESVQGNAGPIKLPTGVTEDSFGANQAAIVDANGQVVYYANMKAALEGIHANAEAGIVTVANENEYVIYCKPYADLGTVTHAHVCSNVTVYGNDAFISGGEGDFEVDTYKFCHASNKACAGLTGDITINVYNLNNVAVWGQRTTDYTVNVNLYECDANRVYISGTKGATNVNVENCVFDGTDGYFNTAVYTNNPGTINVTDTLIKAYAIGINQNNKSAGTQNINLKNCEFYDCATAKIAGAANATTYAAPVRVLATEEATAVSNLVMTDCEFNYSNPSYNGYAIDGNVLILDKRANAVNNGTVNATIDGLKYDYFVSTKDEFAAAVSNENAVVYCNSIRDNYGYFYFSNSGSGGYRHGFPNVAKGVTIVGQDDPAYPGGAEMFQIKGHVNNTFEDVTFKNIVFDSSVVQYGYDSKAFGNVVYENCHIMASSDYAIHFDSGNGTVTYNNCKIVGRVALASSLTAVNFNKCTFEGNKNVANHNLYCPTNYTDCTFSLVDGQITAAKLYVVAPVKFKNCTSTTKALTELIVVEEDGTYTIE